MTRPKQADSAEARRSALLVASVLAALAAWYFYSDRESVALVLAGTSATLAAIAGLSASASLAFHRAWMGLAHVLGWVNSRILLSLVFYCIVTPIALLQRLIGRDALRRRRAPSESYWIPRKTEGQARGQFERLF